MKPTRMWDLVFIGMFATLAAFILVSGLYGQMPPIQASVGLSLYPVAALEAILGFIIRSRLNKRLIGFAREQIHPITAARAVALAKASSLVGAASAGVWLGFLGFVLLHQQQLHAAAADRPAVVVGLIGGVVLTVAALWLERCCQTPDEPPEKPAV